MALTEAQIVAIRRHVGSQPDDATLNEIYDRTGNVDDLVLEILETRRAEFQRVPAAFSVTGEYSQDTRGNLEALEKQIAGIAGGSGTVAFIGPPAPRIR